MEFSAPSHLSESLSVGHVAPVPSSDGRCVLYGKMLCILSQDELRAFRNFSSHSKQEMIERQKSVLTLEVKNDPKLLE